MDFQIWYAANRDKIPRLFAENVSLIDVLKAHDPLTQQVLKGYDAQSSDILKKMDRLDNEYNEAYRELINTEQQQPHFVDKGPPPDRPSSCHRAVDATTEVGPPEIVHCPRSKQICGFDWGTARSRDILPPSSIQQYWISTGRARNTWLDFTSWIADGDFGGFGGL